MNKGKRRAGGLAVPALASSCVSTGCPLFPNAAFAGSLKRATSENSSSRTFVHKGMKRMRSWGDTGGGEGRVPIMGTRRRQAAREVEGGYVR